MTEWLGPNAAGFALSSLPQMDESHMWSPLLPFHDGMSRSEVCSEIYRSLDYLLDGPDPVSGAVQLVFPLRACGIVGSWRLNRVNTYMINLVPIPIWDKVVRLSGFEMIHPLRGAQAVAAASGPEEPPAGSDDEMSERVLDPALRDSPMQDDVAPLFGFEGGG